jgi:hypothetical protein
LIFILFGGVLITEEIKMNHKKHKQQKNLNRPKKEKYNPYANDPPDAKCPYCEQKRKSCSYVNSLSRAWGRDACAKKHS